MATIDDLDIVDIRLGKIIRVEDFPEARKPAYKLTIDFGPEIGIKRSSAQLTRYYTPKTLKNKLILGVVNLPARQIGPFISEVLTVGVADKDGECILVVPNKKGAVLGGKIY